MASRENLNKLEAYSRKVAQGGEVIEADKEELEDHVNRLTKSLQSLQNQVKQHEAAVKVSTSTHHLLIEA